MLGLKWAYYPDKGMLGFLVMWIRIFQVLRYLPATAFPRSERIFDMDYISYIRSKVGHDGLFTILLVEFWQTRKIVCFAAVARR